MSNLLFDSMISNPIHLSFGDYKRLMQKIKEDVKRDDVDPRQLHALYLELERAKKTKARGLSPKIVSMYSTVLIKICDTDERYKFTLVYPDEEDQEMGQFSIYSPLATAVLGFKAGDEFYWTFEDGERKIIVEEVIDEA